MRTNRNNTEMKITITGNEQLFDNAAAWRIIGQILRKKDSVIGLSTGRTTGNMHRTVAKIYREHPFDISSVTFFGQDEVVNVPREYSGSCWKMLKTELIDDIGTDDRHFLMLPVKSDNYRKDCMEFTKELDSRGGIDLLIVGIGENGHIGFNQPGSSFGSTCRVSDMYPELEERIRRETCTPDNVSLGGVTLGVKDIMSAKRIVAVAKGANKSDIVKRIVEGPVNEDTPASILQLHPDCELLLDMAASSKLD